MNTSNETVQAPEQRRSRMISRAQLAKRWGVSKETVKRREAEGLLQPIRFNQRLLRYRLEDIIDIEAKLYS